MSITNIDDNFIQPLIDSPNQYTVPQPQSPLPPLISALPSPNSHPPLNLRSPFTPSPQHTPPPSPRSPHLTLNSRPPSISALYPLSIHARPQSPRSPQPQSPLIFFLSSSPRFPQTPFLSLSQSRQN